MDKRRHSLRYYLDGLASGDKFVLSKAISLVESNLTDDRKLAGKLLARIQKKKRKSFRIGITGSPGVGKSTFIEALGTYLIKKGIRLAVLAIDPSSSKTGGSILGDKTRMNVLSSEKNAFVRPSPSRNTLGGVTNQTSANIELCEEAGYEVVIVETVGVGQSEVAIRNMVDTFIMLVQPASGDELQGIKKGIVEMTDLVVVNKADGELMEAAKNAQKDYQSALHLLYNAELKWTPKVVLCSSVNNTGISDVWRIVLDYYDRLEEHKTLDTLRTEQKIARFEQNVSNGILHFIMIDNSYSAYKQEIINQLKNGEVSESEASDIFLRKVLKT